MLPVAGAAAIILAGPSTRIGGTLDRGPVLFLSAISYSLYLCHWPILFFARYIFNFDSLNFGISIVLIASMIAAAGLMYRFIEQPFQRPELRRKPLKSSALQYAGVVASLALVSHLALLQNGWAWRLSANAIELTRLQKFGMDTCTPIGRLRCAFGSLDAPLGLELVGDSLSHQYVAALDPLLKELGSRRNIHTRWLSDPRWHTSQR
jgi:hypothetical protein